MSAPVSHDPIVVQTGDGAMWRRAAVTVAGRGLYVLDGVAGCPREVMATLPELAVHGVRVPDELAVAVAEHGPFPMPVGDPLAYGPTVAPAVRAASAATTTTPAPTRTPRGR